jgi:hypothetical protein
MSDEITNRAEQIDRYVAGKLKGEEKAIFETNMAIDTDLVEAVEKQKAIHALLVESGLNDIRQLMKDDFKKENKTQKAKWIGGSFLLLAITGIGFYLVASLSSVKLQESSLAEKGNAEAMQTIPQENKTTNTTSQKERQQSGKETAPTLRKGQETVVTESDVTVLANEKNTVEEKQSSVTGKVETSATIHPSSVKANTCEEFKPNYSVKALPSLVRQETGRLTVTASDKTLTYALNNGKANFGSIFDELGAGVYTLSIRNEEGCVYKDESIKIAETYCMAHEKEKFSPEQDQEYQWPIIVEDIVAIKIVNKQFQEVRSYTSALSGWDGRNKEGQLVDTGLYKIEVLYNNGERCLFNLTVFK